MTALLEAGANPNGGHESRGTPLHGLPAIRSAKVVTALVDAGADPKREEAKWRNPIVCRCIPGEFRSGEGAARGGREPECERKRRAIMHLTIPSI